MVKNQTIQKGINVLNNYSLSMYQYISTPHSSYYPAHLFQTTKNY